MNVNLDPRNEILLREKLQSGEYRSADEVINAAMHLLQMREDDRDVLFRVNRGEALPVDDRFDDRVELLVQEAEESGEPREMTAEEWEDIRRQGLALLNSRRRA